jgi:signal transduction histidine kinase
MVAASLSAPSSRLADEGEYAASMEYLIHVVQRLSMTRDLASVMSIVRRAARELTAADGATFVLRERDQCYYAEEDAIAPLWKGQRFPLTACISGWTMLNRQPVIIEDIYADARIPHAAYRPTFVKSLVMVPVRSLDPIAAIGTYWASPHAATPREVKLLQALADTTAVALENVQVYAELEQRVRERTEALETANKDLESFTYSVSHDLRAPVRAIGGFSALLRSDNAGSLDAEMNRKLGIIEQEAARLGRLIEGLLNFARLGTRALKPARIDMTAMVGSVFERLLREQPTTASVDLRLASLPEATGDAALIEHAWTNLLSNAIKFSGKEIAPVIEVSATINDHEHIYSVRDNGAGFDPNYSERLFGVFQRLHHDHEFPGTGVGLALVHKIVMRHGGRIWAESAPAAGATFHFALPASRTLAS